MHPMTDRLASRYLKALEAGDTYEDSAWRIHRFSSSMRITALSNAGLRGKKCLVWSLHSGPEKMNWEGVSDAIVALAKKGADSNHMRAEIEKAKVVGKFEMDEHFERGVDVTPGGFKPLLVRGALVTIKSDYEGFSIEDIHDDQNQSTCIAKGKASVKMFYRFVQDNARALQSKSMHDILDMMTRAGIAYHYYCAMD